MADSRERSGRLGPVRWCPGPVSYWYACVCVGGRREFGSGVGTVLRHSVECRPSLVGSQNARRPVSVRCRRGRRTWWVSTLSPFASNASAVLRRRRVLSRAPTALSRRARGRWRTVTSGGAPGGRWSDARRRFTVHGCTRAHGHGRTGATSRRDNRRRRVTINFISLERRRRRQL